MSHHIGRAVTIPSVDGQPLPAWLALPDGPPRGAIVVLQEIFGVNSHIRSVTERLAARGFAALAPALFQRLEPDTDSDMGMGVELGYSREDMEAGMALKARAEALPGEGVQGDIRAAVHWLAAATGQNVAVLGFCWGGLLAWRAACTLPGVSAAVCYYGGGMTQPAERSRQPACPVMAHFGRKDHFISEDSVQAFSHAQPRARVFLYDADHGFNCDQRSSYDDAAALSARDRTLAFLDEHLKPAAAAA